MIPAIQTVNMLVGKVDYQVAPGNRLSARWSLFNNKTPENIGSTTSGIPNTREVAYDFQDRMDNVGVQLTTALGSSRLNEFRFAFGRRDNPLVASAAAGPGPSVMVTGVANFNGVRYAPNTPVFVERYYQMIDNYNYITGTHNVKLGVDVQLINDERGADLTALYTFPGTAAFLAAKSGADPFGYTQFQQNVGDGSLTYGQAYVSVFAQDDWRLSPQFKVLSGVRWIGSACRKPIRPRRCRSRRSSTGTTTTSDRVPVCVGARRRVDDRGPRIDRHDVRAAARRILRGRVAPERKPAAAVGRVAARPGWHPRRTRRRSARFRPASRRRGACAR